MKQLLTIIALVTWNLSPAQLSKEELPYYQIPEYPIDYNAGTMAARMIDGLGFRYYWATQDLKKNDLDYRPNDDVRSTGETIDHILNLSFVILNSTLMKANDRNDFSKMDFHEKRRQTLINLKTAADILKASDDISKFKIIFGENEIPFWNNVNGPIADAIWHCGQIASFRRSSGNPINPNVNHFIGTVKE